MLLLRFRAFRSKLFESAGVFLPHCLLFLFEAFTFLLERPHRTHKRLALVGAFPEVHCIRVQTVILLIVEKRQSID